jgi:dihydrofolate synthase / folylpolyglutamate synthase
VGSEFAWLHFVLITGFNFMPNAILRKYIKLETALNALIPKIKFSKEINMRLERISHLLDLLGNPQNYFKSIHVGGTSGKGSTSSMISSILASAGYKTGLHLSPHLQLLNERYQINNKIVSTTDLEKIFNKILSSVIEVSKTNIFGQPSYFEVQTAMAFYLFKNKKVDVAVIEVGLGGELDATNVLKSCVSVITNIGLDHTEILGDSVEEIALDKSGIIKERQIVVSGVSQDSVKQIIKTKSIQQNAALWQLGNEFKFTVADNNSFQVICPSKIYSDLRLELPGEFQFTNAACAVAAVNAFSNEISEAVIRKGLNEAFIPGRLEVVQQHPLVILDGAHNPDKMSASVKEINLISPQGRKIIVLSIKDGKNSDEILKILLDDDHHDITVVLTAFEVKGLWSPIPPELLAEKIAKLFPRVVIEIVSHPLDAMKHAIDFAGEDDIVFATGSLYMIGDIRGLWFPLEDLLVKAEGNTF